MIYTFRMNKPDVILIAGPAGSGKTSTAERIALHPNWIHVSEDDHWNDVKAGQPPHALRTREEEKIVQSRVLSRLHEILGSGKKAVLEFILYDDPPDPLLSYQKELSDRGVHYITRILKPDVEEILRRIDLRGREEDAQEALRKHAENQVAVLSSSHIDPSWVIDSSKVPLEEVYDRHFKSLVEPR